jgi:hypothetical protein
VVNKLSCKGAALLLLKFRMQRANVYVFSPLLFNFAQYHIEKRFSKGGCISETETENETIALKELYCGKLTAFQAQQYR